MSYPRNLITPDSTAAHKKALADRAAGRPSAYDLPADLLASIAAAGERR